MVNKAEEATLRILMRQVAPNVKALFQGFAYEWNENFFMLYLTVDYKEGFEIDNPEGTRLVVRSLMSKRNETIVKGNNPNADTLYEFFPYLADFFAEKAAEWELNPYQVYLLLKYTEGTDTDNPEQSILLELKTKNTVPAHKKNTFKIGM